MQVHFLKPSIHMKLRTVFKFVPVHPLWSAFALNDLFEVSKTLYEKQRGDVESRLPDNVPATAFVARLAPSLSLPQTSPLRPRQSASSNRRKKNPEDHG